MGTGVPSLSGDEIRNLVFLRRLVTVLTVTMILGLLAIVTVVVIRVNSGPAPLALPASIVLPEGTRATAFTRGDTWYAVVTDTGEILIYDAASGALRQRVRVGTGRP